MGMSTHVTGIKPADEKFKEMEHIYRSCEKAGIHPPEEVTNFFEEEEPDPRGVCVEIKSHEWGRDCSDGVEVYLDELPKDVKIIRFYNSY